MRMNIKSPNEIYIDDYQYAYTRIRLFNLGTGGISLGFNEEKCPGGYSTNLAISSKKYRDRYKTAACAEIKEYSNKAVVFIYDDHGRRHSFLFGNEAMGIYRQQLKLINSELPMSYESEQLLDDELFKI